jgi:hypothetical protein
MSAVATSGSSRTEADRPGFARRRAGFCLLGLLTLAVVACDGGSTGPYRKGGADSAQAERDLADCRARVDAYVAKDRNIDEDRRGTYSVMSGRPGATSIRERADANSDRRRADYLVSDCMQAKGYTGGDRPPRGIRW